MNPEKQAFMYIPFAFPCNKTGNTGKAALTIKEILDEADANVESMKVEDAEDNEEIIRRDR